MARWQKQIDTKFYKAAQVAAAPLWVGPVHTEPMPAQSEILPMDNPLNSSPHRFRYPATTAANVPLGARYLHCGLFN